MALNAMEKEALKFLGTHLLCGLAAGLTFGLAALYTNLGNLRTLALASSQPALAIFLLFFGLFITFGSLGMGVGIMSLGWDDGEDE